MERINHHNPALGVVGISQDAPGFHFWLVYAYTNCLFCHISFDKPADRGATFFVIGQEVTEALAQARLPQTMITESGLIR